MKLSKFCRHEFKKSDIHAHQGNAKCVFCARTIIQLKPKVVIHHPEDE